MMKIILVVLVVMMSIPASAILVDAENDAESLAMGASLGFMGTGAAWMEEGGLRYGAGSCNLICNNPQDGAWIMTAAHAIRWPQTGETFHYIRYTFDPYFDAYPRGTTVYDPIKSIAAANGKVFYHPTQDIALVKLEHLVYDSTGELITPIEFYHGQLQDNQVILFGGSGQTGIPSQASESGTGYDDGYDRCVRGVFYFFSAAVPSRAVMKFTRSVPLPGIAAPGDSGGFTAIEENGKVLMVGIIVRGTGSGESLLTGFEYLGYNSGFFDWMNTIIQSNGDNSTPTPTNTATATATQTATITASPTPSSTEQESAVTEWGLY
ncbi:MAG: hypothetical protein IT292_08490 [Deltaproteobacteria bacterium]|nr:hypothetical protein [Deltaproteobacteria bacterium]